VFLQDYIKSALNTLIQAAYSKWRRAAKWHWHSRTGRTQSATVTGIVQLSFGLGYPVVEFVEQIVDLEQEMKSK